MISQRLFGTLPDGQKVMEYSLQNAVGMQVDILDLGGIIRRWLVPALDENQPAVDIVLGFDTLDGYVADQAYLGAVVGRYANRIAKGQFALNGKDYQADVNQGGNCLHGGRDGFNSRIWQAQAIDNDNEATLILSLVSNEGDQGFPGTLKVNVTYTLSAEGLKITYRGRSDQDTVFNPTQHSYFNLAGHDSGSVENHQVQILGSSYTPTDQHAIPTGELADVSGTPFDLRELTTLQEPLLSPHEQIKLGNGFDHNWCLDAYQPKMTQAALVAKAVEPASGRTLTVYTTMPGMQLYTANYIGPEPIGKNATEYQAKQAYCFETQYYPDTPNQPQFPSATLKANEDYYSVTEYKLSF
ncbi:aldose epimerase family protein [Paraglaciecola polaris]|uniref:aldose epimerase family protein n=1 Tax=Paraglaciecola polaris TaxID=222814 RepID=UPI0030EE82E1|tara:strand:- start:92 stop:1156 length:1065 start_codon:yes stop_codon:yes gene_type:complete